MLGHNAPRLKRNTPTFTRRPDVPRGFPLVGNGLGGWPRRKTEPPDAWTLTVDITAAGQDWTVRIAAGTGIALVIDWGDGLIERFYAIGNKTHIYNQQGRYYPKISGGFASGGIIRFGEIVGNRARLKATSIVPMIPGLATFSYTFQSCTGLTSLPADLFRYNTAVSTAGFYSTFYGCAGLTSLPDVLFQYNTAVSESGFAYTFQNCTGLTSLPADLFRYNIACTSFNNVFQNCNKLQLRSDIFFPAGGETTRFLNQSVDFTNAMSIGTFTGTQGTAPALWDCTYGTGTPTTTTCFTGHSLASVTNYASIPTAWGGA